MKRAGAGYDFTTGFGSLIINKLLADVGGGGGGGNVPPVANFSDSISGLSVSFTDSSTDSDGSDRLALVELRRRQHVHRDQSEPHLRRRRYLQRIADGHRQQRRDQHQDAVGDGAGGGGGGGGASCRTAWP